MPATEAQIRANQANARLGGPKTEEGKARSRANSYKHGLTGAGIVLADADAAEVERLSQAYRTELQAEGEAGQALAQRMAVLTVRMDRCVDQQRAALSERVRQVMDEFEGPEGADAETTERLRLEAGRRAMFDTSKEATLVRKYEAAAERGFFRAFKELRQLKSQPAKSPVVEILAQAKASMTRLGSFLPEKSPAQPSPSKPAPAASKPVPARSKPAPVSSKAIPADWDPFAPTHFDVPFAIGRAR
jgi:hypothetical protein